MKFAHIYYALTVNIIFQYLVTSCPTCHIYLRTEVKNTQSLMCEGTA